MPARPPKTSKRDAQFRESLAPTLPLAATTAGTTVVWRSPVLVFTAWVVAMVLIGIAVGLALRPQATDLSALVAPGPVAVVTDPPGNRVVAAKIVAQQLVVSPNLATIETGTAAAADKLAVASVLATGTKVQATLGADTLFYAGDINALQSGFSVYGTQGSVGIAAVR